MLLNVPLEFLAKTSTNFVNFTIPGAGCSNAIGHDYIGYIINIQNSLKKILVGIEHTN